MEVDFCGKWTPPLYQGLYVHFLGKSTFFCKICFKAWEKYTFENPKKSTELEICQKLDFKPQKLGYKTQKLNSKTQKLDLKTQKLDFSVI